MNSEIKSATARIGNQPYATELTVRTHVLHADEPVENGGKDTGPAPQDFLRMSLAACTAITLRMYATRKNMTIEEIDVEVSQENVEGKTIFHREVKIKGTIDEQQRERLLQIANLCPVHKILTNPIEVRSQVKQVV